MVFEQNYQTGGNVKVGKNRGGMKGRFSDKTFGGGGFKINKNGGSDLVYVGKEYKTRGNIKVNGKEVGKVNGRAKGKLIDKLDLIKIKD